MPYNGSGSFTRVMDWTNDAAAKIKILADRHDQNDDDLAAGLSNAICKDGQTSITQNIGFNGKKITNLADPTAAQDAATRHYVDTLTGWTTSKNLSGTGTNGRLNFTGGSGINGVTWTSADMALVGKAAEASKSSKRLTVNNAATAAGSDVLIIDEAGRINNAGYISHNLSYDGASWRTIGAGFGTCLQYINGALVLMSNDAATTVAYGVATLRQAITLQNAAGSAVINLTKSASAKTSALRGYVGAELRWQLQLGDSTAEGASNAGSNFSLHCYDNNGTIIGAAMSILRGTRAVTFYGDVTVSGNDLTAANLKGTHVPGSGNDCIVAGGSTTAGRVLIRPLTAASTDAQLVIDKDYVTVHAANVLRAGKGIQCSHDGGTYQTQVFEIAHFSGVGTGLYVNGLWQGYFAYTCDYRYKTDIQPLGSMWDKVKALKPIRYVAIGEGPTGPDDREQWGMVAHELQETLTETAATGHKDIEGAIQSPNLLAVTAALTKALQEAMARIEALEAR